MLSSKRALIIYPCMPPLRAGDLFISLSFGGRIRLADQSDLRLFSKGSKIFEANSAAARVWILKWGKAHLRFPNAFGDGTVPRLAFPGEVFGLTETLAQMPYGATLIAGSVCAFSSIHHNELTELLRNEPMFRRKLLGVLSENYINAYNKLVRRTHM